MENPSTTAGLRGPVRRGEASVPLVQETAMTENELPRYERVQPDRDWDHNGPSRPSLHDFALNHDKRRDRVIAELPEW